MSHAGNRDLFARPTPFDDALPFVGRAGELTALTDQLNAVLLGSGSIAMLSGEPGVGKTQTVRQFAAAARARGVAVLWGRCFEGEWSPPFAPWVEALAGYADASEPIHLRQELGFGAASIAQLVPAIRAAFPELPAPSPLGAEDERVRVVDAIAQFVLAIARRQATAFVLDDLHWADPATLGLLRYLGRVLPEAPLFLIGTYRDAEIDQGHALTAALAELRRGPGFRHLPLVGLDVDETRTLVETALPCVGSPELAVAIHGLTAGNPLFTGELMRHLREEGWSAPRPGHDIASDLRLLEAPEGVRHLISRRLARFSPDAGRMLSYAAIFAGGFDFRVLQALTEMDDERLLDALDEALAGGLIRPIEGRGERYDFGHAIVRQVLAANWSPSRLIRLHRRLAEALERVYAGRELDVAAELAIQYHESAVLPGATKGIDYALAAAAQARANAAREQAVGFLRIARDLAALSDQGVPAALLAKLALAEAEALFLDDARRTVEQTMAAFVAAGSAPEEIAAFLAVVAAALEDGGASVAEWQPLVERGLALLEAAPGSGRGLTWARLKLTLKAFAPISRGTINASRWLGSDPTAVAIARAGSEEDFARTIQPFDVRTPEETRALLVRARGWTNPVPRIRVLIMAGADRLYYHGQVREAIAVFEELLETSEQVGSVSGQAEALIRLAIAQTTLGEFALAQGTAQRAQAAVGRLGTGHHLRTSVAWIDAFRADNLEGDWTELADFWTAFAADPRAGENGLVVDDAALAAYAHARAGNVGEARRLLQALTPLLEQLAPTDWLVNGAVAFGAAALWWLEASDLAPTYRVLARSLVSAGRGDYPGTSNDLSVARMAALTGARAEAAEHFARARLAASASGRRPLRAMVDYDEARALLRLGGADPERAAALAGAAATAFSALGMSGWAERARTLRTPARRGGDAAGLIDVREHPGNLTDREVTVLQLVARGFPDRAISERLELSPRTVQSHLRNMFRKTDTTNRTELSVWAAEHGLLAAESGGGSP